MTESNPSQIVLHDYSSADLVDVVNLFTASVHGVAASHYDAQQLEAWAPETPDLDVWSLRLDVMHTILAEADGRLAGFVSYENNGHIAYLYTAPDAIRRGVASTLLQTALDRLVASGVTHFSTEASLLARPVFEKHGFKVVAEETVERNGEALRRFRMTRTITH